MPECMPLPCFRAPGVAVSCWKFPSLRERIKFLLRGEIWLYVFQNSHPPISVAVHKPFPKAPAS